MSVCVRACICRMTLFKLSHHLRMGSITLVTIRSREIFKVARSCVSSKVKSNHKIYTLSPRVFFYTYKYASSWLEPHYVRFNNTAITKKFSSSQTYKTNKQTKLLLFTIPNTSWKPHFFVWSPPILLIRIILRWS